MTHSLCTSGSQRIVLIVPVAVVPAKKGASPNQEYGSHLLPTHQLDPCGSQGPRQTQQNSALQVLQCMWLQPPFFSMVAWHFGHSCERYSYHCY